MSAAGFAPRVSIIIPVYNGADYLREAVDSALAQTYADVEILVVNDGSSDGGRTAGIARSFGSRIRYVEKPNGGCGSALNAGIAQMSGAYFSWLSHDDVYLPEKVATQVAILESLADRQTILYGSYELIDDRSRSLGFVRPDQVGSAKQLNTPLYPLARGLLHGCTMLVARSLFARYGQFDESLRSTQDYDLWFRFLRRVPIRYDPRPLVRSRVHAGQGTHTIASHAADCDALWTRLLTEVTPEEAAAIDGSHYRYLRETARFLAGTPYRGAIPLANEMAEQVLSDILVSVVIPFRDRIAWTLEAIRSALAQSHAKLEVIAVDDGSTRDTSPVLALAEQDHRLRYVRQEALGVSAARNRGVELAAGRYVAFLDSDDLFVPEKVASQLRYMEDRHLQFCHTGYRRMDDDGGDGIEVDTSYCSGQAYPRIIAASPIATPTVMARTDLLRRHPFPDGIGAGEDIITWVGIAEGATIGALAAPLSRVRVAASTTGVDSRKYQRGILNLLGAVLDHPRHGRQHAEILQLIEVLWDLRREESRAESAPTAARSRGQRRLRDHGGGLRHGLHLLRRGWTSLILHGPGVTWQRVRQWRHSRQLRRPAGGER